MKESKNKHGDHGQRSTDVLRMVESPYYFCWPLTVERYFSIEFIEKTEGTRPGHFLPNFFIFYGKIENGGIEK